MTPPGWVTAPSPRGHPGHSAPSPQRPVLRHSTGHGATRGARPWAGGLSRGVGVPAATWGHSTAPPQALVPGCEGADSGRVLPAPSQRRVPLPAPAALLDRVGALWLQPPAPCPAPGSPRSPALCSDVPGRCLSPWRAPAEGSGRRGAGTGDAGAQQGSGRGTPEPPGSPPGLGAAGTGVTLPLPLPVPVPVPVPGRSSATRVQPPRCPQPPDLALTPAGFGLGAPGCAQLPALPCQVLTGR